MFKGVVRTTSTFTLIAMGLAAIIWPLTVAIQQLFLPLSKQTPSLLPHAVIFAILGMAGFGNESSANVVTWRLFWSGLWRWMILIVASFVIAFTFESILRTNDSLPRLLWSIPAGAVFALVVWLVRTKMRVRATGQSMTAGE